MGVICDPNRAYFGSALCALDAPDARVPTLDSADQTARLRCVRRVCRLSLTVVVRRDGLGASVGPSSPSTGATFE